MKMGDGRWGIAMGMEERRDGAEGVCSLQFGVRSLGWKGRSVFATPIFSDWMPRLQGRRFKEAQDSNQRRNGRGSLCQGVLQKTD